VPKIVPAACLLVILASPPARGLLKGALLVPQVIPAPVHPLAALTPAPRRSVVHLPGGEADLYRPRGLVSAPGIVLVHGANPGGKDDPRVVDLARSLAREGRRVLVPQLGLRNQRLDLADPGRIRDAVTFLAGAAHGRVGVLAFSYGAGLSAVALASSPDVQRRVAFLATVGTYFDLFHLLQGATTGTVPYLGRTVSWRPDPQALAIAADQLAAFLGRSEGDALARAWRNEDPTGLAPGPGAAYQLLANRDPSRFEELARRLPEGLAELLRFLSPASAVDKVTVPVFALHARQDPASPPTESRLLVAALSRRVEARLFIVGNLSHVSPTASITADVADAFRLASFGAMVLGAQEGWPRP
jgi:pimeloyl-ACP methyl ester carboxylesterase